MLLEFSFWIRLKEQKPAEEKSHWSMSPNDIGTLFEMDNMVRAKQSHQCVFCARPLYCAYSGNFTQTEWRPRCNVMRNATTAAAELHCRDRHRLFRSGNDAGQKTLLEIRISGQWTKFWDKKSAVLAGSTHAVSQCAFNLLNCVNALRVRPCAKWVFWEPLSLSPGGLFVVVECAHRVGSETTFGELWFGITPCYHAEPTNFATAQANVASFIS